MKRIVSILIDKSGSMGRMDYDETYKEKYKDEYLVGDKSRMDLVKSILMKELLPSMKGIDEVIIQTFTTNMISKVPDYKSTGFIQYNLEQINKKINGMRNPTKGGTPITGALEYAFAKLLSHITYKDKKMILLITDGDENGGGDYTKKVRDIGSCACEVHIIGLGLNPSLKQKATLAAESTGGTFTDVEIPTGYSFDSVEVNAIQNLLRLKQALSRFISGSQPNDALSEDDAQINEQIRAASEKALFHHLKSQHGDRVQWLNDPFEKGENHDFKIIGINSNEPIIYIECKGTPGNKPTFYLTASEWRLALKHGSNYELYFIQNCFDQPSFTKFTNIIDALATSKLLPYSLEEEHLQPKRIALTVASTQSL